MAVMEQMENMDQPELCRLHTLRISHIDQRGIWLEAGKELAHLPKREAAQAAPGEELEVFLYRVVPGELQATRRRPFAQAGEFAFLSVRSVDQYGAFLDWGLAKDLLAPFSLQPEKMQVGRRYLVKVDIDEQGRPFASGRIEDCLEPAGADLREGEPVELIVWQLTELGAKVIVNQRFSALLYREELPAGCDTGLQLSGYVKRLREDGKLDVTLRKVGAEAVADAREVLLRVLTANDGSLPLHDQSSPALIKQILGMSKKTFKKAIGGLYKDGLVTLTAEGVSLKAKKPKRA